MPMAKIAARTFCLILWEKQIEIPPEILLLIFIAAGAVDPKNIADLGLLQWVHPKHYIFDVPHLFPPGIIPNLRRSIRYGALKCLIAYEESDQSGNISRDCEAYRYAARYGQSEILQHLIARNYIRNPWAIYDAAERGYLDCLRLLLEDLSPLSGRGEAYYYAAKGDHTHCFRLLLEYKYPIPQSGRTWCAIAKSGNLECFTLALENGFPLHPDGYYLALRHNQLSCYERMLEHDFPKNAHPYIIAARKDDDDELYARLIRDGFPITNGVVIRVARSDEYTVLEWLLKKGFPTEGALVAAISQNRYESLEILIRYHAQRDPNGKEYTTAVCNGNLNCLELLYASGFAIFNTLYCEAIRYSQTKALQFLIDKECPRSENGLEYYWAIKFNSPECLRILIENRFKQCCSAMINAARLDRPECLRILLENGFPGAIEASQVAFRCENYECLEILVIGGVAVSDEIRAAYENYLRSFE